MIDCGKQWFSEDLFIPDSTKSLSTNSYRWTHDFFRQFFSRFPFDGFSADSSRKKSSFHTHGICTVCNVADILRPFTPHVISTVDSSFFCTSEEIAFRRTFFLLNQYVHNLCQFANKTLLFQYHLSNNYLDKS